MKVVIQRVKKGAVYVEGKKISEIGSGLLVFAGMEKGDTQKDIEYIAKKVSEIRIFDDEEGKLNRSVIDVSGEILVVSQFTLLANTKKGRRPSYTDAMEPENASRMLDVFVNLLKERGISVKEGKFQASMEVELINMGPVTIIIDSKDKFPR